MYAIKSNVLNVIRGTIEQKTIYFDDRITAQGKVENEYDFSDYYLLPGLIDGHIHIESSMLTPENFSRAAVPHGTTCVIFEPHEIANVCGVRGIWFMLSTHTPMRLFFTAPSCVPATEMETSGSRLDAEDVSILLKNPRCAGLGEMMNFPGVINKDPEVMKKINEALALGKVCDGHAPGLTGKQLKKYVSAGIMSDHECTSAEEAREKISLGMRIMIREGSAAKNLRELAKIIKNNESNCMLVSDDVYADELLNDGHMDRILRKAVSLGIDPITAVKMATINPAKYFKLEGLGAIEIGYKADFVVVRDLEKFDVEAVFIDGKLIYNSGKILWPPKNKRAPNVIRNSVKLKIVKKERLMIEADGSNVTVMGVIPDEIITSKKIAKLKADRFLLPDTDNDILPLVVVERHKMTGNIGKGFVSGFGLKKGALASTVAHDSHNIICVAADYDDMLAAINELKRINGGLVAADKGNVEEKIELPIAGLMSEQNAESVASEIKKINEFAKELGCKLPNPFATLSFLALPVIPSLKLTDKGLFDVNEFKFTNLIRD
ncbi:MAG: adenine deaminase [Candidatus Aenigmatarchaeota archaeon]